METNWSRTTFSLLLFLLGICSTTLAESEYQRVVLADNGEFSIRLAVRKTASLADEVWLGLELENLTSHDLFVTHFSYVLNYEAKPVGDSKGWSSMLCSGDDVDAFLRGTKIIPSSEKFVKAKSIHRVFQSLSDSAAATLELSTQLPWVTADADTELQVQATARVWLHSSPRLGAGVTRIDPNVNVPFQFRWKPPVKSTIPDLSNRLLSLIGTCSTVSHGRAGHLDDLACALLKRRDIAAGLAKHNLEFAAELPGPFHQSVRLEAARCLHERNPGDSRYLEQWKQILHQSPHLASNLVKSGFWHKDLVGVLVEATRRPYARSDALRLLETHREDWQNDPAVVAKLAAIQREYFWRMWWQTYGGWLIALGVAVLTGGTIYKISRKFVKKSASGGSPTSKI